MSCLSTAPTLVSLMSAQRLPTRLGGFSLIEMLVALVVLSLSLGALYQAAAGATRNVRVGAEYTQAIMVAESVLSEYSYVSEENFSAAGVFSRYGYEVFSWPAPLPSAEFEDSAGQSPEQQASLQFLKVIVRWEGGSQPREIDLMTVVPLRRKPE